MKASVSSNLGLSHLGWVWSRPTLHTNSLSSDIDAGKPDDINSLDTYQLSCVCAAMNAKHLVGISVVRGKASECFVDSDALATDVFTPRLSNLDRIVEPV